MKKLVLTSLALLALVGGYFIGWWNDEVVIDIPAPTFVETPKFQSEFTIDSVVDRNDPKDVRLGGALTEVPATTQVFDRTAYFAHFTDPSRNNVVIHMNITKEQYDKGEYPDRSSLVWVSNDSRPMMKSVPTVLKNGEFAVVAGEPEAVQSTTTDGVIWMPTKAYRVKESGKAESLLTSLPSL